MAVVSEVVRYRSLVCVVQRVSGAELADLVLVSFLLRKKHKYTLKYNTTSLGPFTWQRTTSPSNRSMKTVCSHPEYDLR